MHGTRGGRGAQDVQARPLVWNDHGMGGMSAFWIIGIAINLLLLAAGRWWIVQNWKQGDEPKPRRDDDGEA